VSSRIDCEVVLTCSQLIDALRIRVAVFIQEQGFSVGWEPDETDKVAQHYIASLDGCTVATARTYQSEPGKHKIERMAVLKPYRRKGIGTYLTLFIIADVKQLWLNAQDHAVDFYERCRFCVVSDVHFPCGVKVPHVTMEYLGDCDEKTSR